jgi:hypothetical protein
MFRQVRALKPILALLLIMVWTSWGPASAQMQATVHASAPVTDRFPQITVFVTLFDGSGRRIPGLPPSSFSVLEDEIPLLDLTVTEKDVGTRQVFVINTSADLKVRDALGYSRFEIVRDALLEWWQLPEASLLNVDDLSLITAEGAQVIHSQSTADLASSLVHLAPAFKDDISGYDLLLQSLDFTSDPPLQPGMPNHLVFISSLLHIPRDLPLANIVARASETETTIHPVLIGQPEMLELPEAEPLTQLAEATGGQLILFDPTQGLNSLASRILSERTQYELTYTSHANTPGSHQVQIRITGDGLDAFSDPLSFEIDVQPPSVAFIQPPDLIIRGTDDPTLALDLLPPTTHRLQLLITFPDGYPRAVNSSKLLVDGDVVAQHTKAPFDVFDWDLSGYLEDASHTLQATVEDSLGLQGFSIQLPVSIEVETPPRGLSTLRPALGSILAALAVLIVGVFLAINLSNLSRKRLIRASTTKKAPSHMHHQLKRASLRRPTNDHPVEAHLVPLDARGEEGKPIPLSGVDLTLGRNPSITPFPLDDPSVATMHARLIRQAGGDYVLRDQGSVAGTWVNYQIVPEEGQLLKHGDLIHIGRVAFRFRSQTPPPPPEIRIRPAEEDQLARHPNQEKST